MTKDILELRSLITEFIDFTLSSSSSTYLFFLCRESCALSRFRISRAARRLSSSSQTVPPSSESTAVRDADADGETSPSPDRRHLATSELRPGLDCFRFRLHLGSAPLLPSSDSSCLTSQLPFATAELDAEVVGEDDGEAVGPDPAAEPSPESSRSGDRRRKSSTEKSPGRSKSSPSKAPSGRSSSPPAASGRSGSKRWAG
uniref:Uncharacterized protein n=1 Tax=Oryza brachyantha TaxID=4533 RepID=J3M757_ORYBR